MENKDVQIVDSFHFVIITKEKKMEKIVKNGKKEKLKWK